MARQTIVWTVLPNGRVPDGDLAGRRRVTVVVSPRLTPEAADEQALQAFPAFLDWPATLAGTRFELTAGGTTTPLHRLTAGDSTLWGKLFGPQTPVDGFRFQDMSQVNLRSYAVRNVLGYLRRHYGRLAVQSTSRHPTLLPWRDAHPDLKGMLGAIGTRTHTLTFNDRDVEILLPGFSRFFDDENRESLDARLRRTVFGPNSVYRMPVAAATAEAGALPGTAGQVPRRVLPPDWNDPNAGGGAGGDAAVMAQFASADEYTFYQANRFYRREPPSKAQRAMRRPSYTDVPPPPQAPEFDFHRIVASYGDLPQLLRALGLIVDCAIEDDGFVDAAVAAGGGTGNGQMRVQIEWPNGVAVGEDVTPRSAWEADDERFVMRPRGELLRRGLLRLEHAGDGWGGGDDRRGLFDLYQVDPDGAALKTVGFTLTAQNLVGKSLSLRQQDGEVTYTTGDRQAVAALRSGGLGVSRHGRAAEVAQAAAEAALKNDAIVAGNGNDAVLFAEDVVRGYRVDVSPVPDPNSPGRWFSLCQRSGDYRLIASGEAVALPDDEGYAGGPATTSTASEGVDPDDHYLHESLFRWTGWSLCAPRPGLTLRAQTVEGTQMQAEQPATIDDKLDTGNGIAATFKARPGTLPRLRFGQLYRLRARAVDLAGNSLALDDPSLGEFEQASDATGYWRFEPVDPPAMVQRHRLSEGESLERMVVRSNFDVDTQGYLATADFSAAIALPPSQDFEYTALGERHLVPPKSAQQQCEQHGLFDPYFGDPQKIKDGYAIAARESGTLFDGPPGAQVELVTPAALGDVATTASVPPELPNPDNPIGDRLRGGQYLIHREAAVTTPYLPDAASGGIAIRAQPDHDLPGVTDEVTLGPSCAVRRAANGELVILIAHGGDWPDSRGARLVLAERPATLGELPCTEAFADDGAPQWDEDTRTLTLFVAKGRVVRLWYASFVHPGAVRAFGIPRWTSNGSERGYVRAMAVMGCSWMLTPFRPLVLVHATQQPVCLPELIKLSNGRPAGAQYTDLSCRQVVLHGPSTGKFEIEARWHEWTDDLAKPAPERVEHRGQLGEVLLPENAPNVFTLAGAINAQVVDPARPRARADRHELGDTRFRLIEYRVRATTRFREYLPPSLYEDREKVTRLGPIALGPAMTTGADDDPGAPVLHDPAGSKAHTLVRASAPPDDPRVLYVVPTFRWAHDGPADERTVTRWGNGLRVWLDRPWFSSGDGELLGVIIAGNGARFTDIPAAMQTVVTQWGLDPLWDTALPKTRTRAQDFPARVADEAVPLLERPERNAVHVVGHRVHWDGGRGLWYCDIELNPGASYMPFVRLALVRYQPHAIGGAKVSKVVLAEFAQVLPRRRATVKVSDRTVNLTLRGTTPQHGPMKFPVDSEFQDVSFLLGPHETGRNRVELVLQRRDPDIDSDLAWRDVKVLAETIAGTQTGGVFAPGTNPGGIFAQPAVRARGRRTVAVRAGGRVRLDTAFELDVGSIGGGIGTLFPTDPTIWSRSVNLPSPSGAPERLMLREFERYYTDRTVPETVSGRVHRRRVIEERLVYASVFDIAT